VGASARQVFDLSDPNNTRSVLPPGQSGQVFHRNYDDQVPVWLNGSYRIIPMDEADVNRQARLVLMLRPGE